jgi:phosphotransferase system HPr-like phosphotransfer protein
VIIEWAEYLPADAKPDNALVLTWLEQPQGRLVTIQASGTGAENVLACLTPQTAGFTA